MPNWRDELSDAVKTKAEREREEQERHRLRVQEALASAEGALTLAVEGVKFSHDRIVEKGQAASLVEEREDVSVEGGASESRVKSSKLSLGSHTLGVELDRTTAILKVSFLEGKPREFDFARDRHIAAVDVEEYVGRRAVEFVRAAQKSAPW